jgi:two-component system OmpR family response regulator
LPARNILVVDDEKRIVEIIKAYLERDGYRVDIAYDGQAALDLARQKHPDLIVLDLMLPVLSGWDVCRLLRKESDIPIIMLTARDDTTDKIVGLELGADDYITKPFDPKEVVSRVKAVLRRYELGGISNHTHTIVVDDLNIDADRHTVTRGGLAIDLTSTEFSLLWVLAENPGKVFSRMQLLDRMQGDAYEGYERTIDSHIKNLRKKLESDPDHPKYIITVYGSGYKLEENPGA